MTEASNVERATLLPCPFCGGEAEMDTQRCYMTFMTPSRLGSQVAIYCTQCSADQSICREDHRDADTETLISIVTEAWNKRALSPPPPVPCAGEKEPTEKELWENGCLTRHQLANWTDNDLAKHSAGIRKTLQFLFDHLAATPSPPRQGVEREKIAHLLRCLLSGTDVSFRPVLEGYTVIRADEPLSLEDRQILIESLSALLQPEGDGR